MEINKKRHGLVNPKTGKVYSTVFKKRTVQFYLSGRYDEQAIWKIFKVNAYIKLLKKNKVEISMTEYGDPYENILAERINKTIKEEFLNEFIFLNFKEAKSVTAKSC